VHIFAHERRTYNRAVSAPLPSSMLAAESTLDAELELAIDAARRAGAIQMDRYERLERIVHKSKHDVVTEVDHLCEELILGSIREAYPDDAYLAEESGRSEDLSGRGEADQRRVWIVDPLDGTVNYANGIPVFCVSIALVVAGLPALGVLFDPVHGELFTARAGEGTRLDGAPIHHPTKERMSDLVVALTLPPYGFARREWRIRKRIRVSRVMGSASLALAWVANGRFDAFVQPAGLSLWDVAAAGLIAAEGGAVVTDRTGGQWFDLSRKVRGVGIVAAAPAHQPTFLELIR
jgi:myo-inositol-1(or 4)-monophosphatase